MRREQLSIFCLSYLSILQSNRNGCYAFVASHHTMTSHMHDCDVTTRIPWQWCARSRSHGFWSVIIKMTSQRLEISWQRKYRHLETRDSLVTSLILTMELPWRMKLWWRNRIKFRSLSSRDLGKHDVMEKSVTLSWNWIRNF